MFVYCHKSVPTHPTHPTGLVSQLKSTASSLIRPLVRIGGAAVMRPVLIPKCASSNYTETRTPSTYTNATVELTKHCRHVQAQDPAICPQLILHRRQERGEEGRGEEVACCCCCCCCCLYSSFPPIKTAHAQNATHKAIFAFNSIGFRKV